MQHRNGLDADICAVQTAMELELLRLTLNTYNLLYWIIYCNEVNDMAAINCPKNGYVDHDYCIICGMCANGGGK